MNDIAPPRPGAVLAFLNADWRNFESTPAKKESPDHAITLFDFHRLLSESGWKITHRIECPLSSQRLSGTQVQRMQGRRTLGTINRTLLPKERGKRTATQHFQRFFWKS